MHFKFKFKKKERIKEKNLLLLTTVLPLSTSILTNDENKTNVINEICFSNFKPEVTEM